MKESSTWNENVVNELVRASAFLAEILNNTLDISKLEEGKIEFNKSYQSIQGVTDFVLNVTKANADKKSIIMEAVYGEKIPSLLEFDNSRITQILMNLVGNAIKFTAENGKITVTVTWQSKNDIKILAEEKKSQVTSCKKSSSAEIMPNVMPDTNEIIPAERADERNKLNDSSSKSSPGSAFTRKRNQYQTEFGFNFHQCKDIFNSSQTVDHPKNNLNRFQIRSPGSGESGTPTYTDISNTVRNNELQKGRLRSSFFKSPKFHNCSASVAKRERKNSDAVCPKRKKISPMLGKVGNAFRMSEKQIPKEKNTDTKLIDHTAPRIIKLVAPTPKNARKQII